MFYGGGLHRASFSVGLSSSLISWLSKSTVGTVGVGNPYIRRAALQGLSAVSLFSAQSFVGLRSRALLVPSDELAGDVAFEGGVFEGGVAIGAGVLRKFCTDWICNGALRNAMITLLTGALKRLPEVACIPLSWQ